MGTVVELILLLNRDVMKYYKLVENCEFSESLHTYGFPLKGLFTPN